MRILLVDDEVISLNALKKRIDWLKCGFTEVFAVQDAEEARELLNKHVIDMILCDIEMPGESGLSLVAYVKAAYPDTECIMITCHADFAYVKTAIKIKVSDYILKPIDYYELESQLSRFENKRVESQQNDKVNEIISKASASSYSNNVLCEGRIEIIRRYIDGHIQEKIYIEDLAKLVHINERHLMRIFKRETGDSVTEYITQQRILIAGNLLKHTNNDINFIANCTGFENYSYFTKLFKRCTGFTPSEYRKL